MKIPFGLSDFSSEIINSREEREQETIWAPLRKKMVKLTPEEWVRQHLIYYLIHYKHYPKALLTEEYLFYYHNRQKRADLLIYSPLQRKSLLLVECKSQQKKLQKAHLTQLMTYNHIVKAPLVMLTNGEKSYVAFQQLEEKNYISLSTLPTFEELMKQV